ncbi:hypothetical protein J3459_008210 [Metarhizium acridum]|uniref:uncharacterized protein n=1 Tax=Metarhizium acridum TaxID=92637 RepID=UPI001C6AEDD5|nr:hypothetical protein J3458_000012 [Metarhizium acridum]KAG8426296.1 hypothetical protein J3459_008210 [Metarhizium acridum]
MSDPEKSDAVTPAPARSSDSIEGWVHASVIFLKVIFATGVLTIFSAMFVLAALPGAINVLRWQFLNTYCAIIQGNFRNAHAGCHSIADMTKVVGGLWLKEVTGVFFLVTYTIVCASRIFGTSAALNAL